VISSDSVAVGAADSVVVDAEAAGSGPISTGVLPPGSYRYRVSSAAAVVTEGRFDVAAATDEMVPSAVEPAAAEGASTLVATQPAGRPLRTRPWPYLLVIALLCGEWIGRRRSGLR